MSAMRSILISLMALIAIGTCEATDMIMQSNVYVEDGTLASKTTLNGVVSTAYGTGNQREILGAMAVPENTQFSWDYMLDGQKADPMNYVKYESKANGMAYKIDSWASNQINFQADTNHSEGDHEVTANMIAKNSWYGGERVFTNMEDERYSDWTNNVTVGSHYRMTEPRNITWEGDWLSFCEPMEVEHPDNDLHFTPARSNITLVLPPGSTGLP